MTEADREAWAEELTRLLHERHLADWAYFDACAELLERFGEQGIRAVAPQMMPAQSHRTLRSHAHKSRRAKPDERDPLYSPRSLAAHKPL